MPIITDPDLLSRNDVIFSADGRNISIYPVGDTQRGANVSIAWVSNTSSITRADGGNFSTDSVVVNDIVTIFVGEDAGHYYVNAVSASTLTLANVDAGKSSAAVAHLTNNTISVTDTGVSTADDTFNITAHGKSTGDALVFTTTGTAPTGISNATVYYAIVPNTTHFQLATTYSNALAGSNVDITAAGSGTFTFNDRIVVKVFNNGASNVDSTSTPAGENIDSNDTTGDGDGDVKDGISMQALYSFAKDEWRTDSLISAMGTSVYNDDLIRHEFPIEAITAEQFEIGGGTNHDDWTPFNNYTNKKVRTGGWAEKTRAQVTNDLERFTGIITLGALDVDAQVYYQQVSEITNPANFTFLGAVNEALSVYLDSNQDGSPDYNRTTYLKLFVRKKARTYSQSAISDIGVTTIQTIVNRFPLTHATDAAITADDAHILGITPWRVTAVNPNLVDKIDGAITAAGFTFTDADQEFQSNGVVAGDTLRITAGTSDYVNSYFTIASVDSETQLTLKNDVEFTSAGWSESNTGITYEVYSPYRVATRSAGAVSVISTGILEDGDQGDTVNVGKFTDSTASAFANSQGFGSVVRYDLLWVQDNDTANAFYGVYKVLDVNDDNALSPTATVIYVDTTDNPWPATQNTAVDYTVLTKGMYLEYKKSATQNLSSSVSDTITSYANGSIQLAGTLTWDTTVDAGTIIEFTSDSTLNEGSYTVASKANTTFLTLLGTDTLAAETLNTSLTDVLQVYEGYKRTIGGSTYAFNWKLFAGTAALSSCYQFVQHQLRETTDINYGKGVSRGDITNLLLQYAAPTGTTLNMFIEDLSADDINNTTFQDHSGANRNYPFTASGSLVFNSNLTDDSDAKYWLFFSNDDAGDNVGRDYGTDAALIVRDSNNVEIKGNVSSHVGGRIAFTYAYDSNVQRGAASAGVDAPVTLVAIGLNTAQFVISTGTISRTTGITISAVASLERNYLPGTV